MRGFLLYAFLIALRPKRKMMLKAGDNEVRRNFMTINLIKICVNQHLD